MVDILSRIKVKPIINSRVKCPYYGKCPHCHLQHRKYSSQLRLKRRVLRKLFGEEIVGEMVPSPAEYHWANRGVFRLFKYPGDGPRVLGFDDGGGNVMDIRECSLLYEPLNKLYLELSSILKLNARFYDGQSGELTYLIVKGSIRTREYIAGIVSLQRVYLKRFLRDFFNTKDIKGISLIIEKSPGSFKVRELLPILGDKFYYERINGKLFRISIVSHFPRNTHVFEKVLGDLVPLVDGAEHVVDAFGSVGVISATVSPVVGRVTLVEPSRSAVADARENFYKHDVFNGDVVRARVADALRSLRHDRPGVVIVSPPEKGLKFSEINALIKTRAERIIYLSRSLNTFYRDVRFIVRKGKYRLVRVNPYDMYPQQLRFFLMGVLEKENL